MLIQRTKKLLDELKVQDRPLEEDSFYSWHANLLKTRKEENTCTGK